jgi:hypothetical protein
VAQGLAAAEMNEDAGSLGATSSREPCRWRYFTVSVSWMGGSWSDLPEEDIALSVIVMVEVPEGVMTGGGVRKALPPPQPATPRTTLKTAVARTAQSLKRLGPAALCNLLRFFKAIQRTSASANKGNTRSPGVGLRRGGAEGGKMAAPLVVTVTVNGAAAPFEIDTLAGTWQLAPRGAPLHASEMLPL